MPILPESVMHKSKVSDNYGLGMMCRGSIQFGTGCRRCSRCRAELEKMSPAISKEDAFDLPVDALKPLEAWTLEEKVAEGLVSLEAWHNADSALNKPQSPAVSVVLTGANNPPAMTEMFSTQPAEARESDVKAGLPVLGYAAQEQWKIDMVNQNKKLEEQVLRQIDFMASGPHAGKLDQRSVQMARGLIEDAFMRLNRGVFRPTRILGDL